MCNELYSHHKTVLSEYLQCPSVALSEKASLLDTSSQTSNNIRKSNREHKQAAKIQKQDMDPALFILRKVRKLQGTNKPTLNAHKEEQICAAAS